MLATDSSSGKRIKILKKSDEIPRILSWEAKRGIDLLKFLKEKFIYFEVFPGANTVKYWSWLISWAFLY